MKPTRFCCFFLLLLALLACRLSGGADDNGGNTSEDERDNPNVQLCKKYESCGCQSYRDCMAGAKNSPSLDKPGVRECMLASSCESLCAGKPDGCLGQSAGQGSTTTPQKSNCAAISCSKNSDCPSDCYGGCDGVRCYSF
ncbi:MAG TPA: hypothetical protein VF553_15245 [Pyrinomonadaceae bacterium]